MAGVQGRVIDIAFGVAALAVSAISLWVALGTEDANRKMVAASTWPLLQLEMGNNEDGKSVITLSLVNAGVGPAKVESFEVIWKGKAYGSHSKYLLACCGLHEPLFNTPENQQQTPVQSAPVVGHAIRAGEQRPFLRVPLGKDNLAAWKVLDLARFGTKFRACYCSVFDECWQSDLTGVKPTPIAACNAPKVGYRE